jgi:hypothetical protein
MRTNELIEWVSRSEQDGIAVWASTGDRSGAQRTAAAALVLDDNRAQQWFDLLCPWTTDRVEPSARRKRNHKPDRTRRIGLRPRDARDGRQRGSARGQMQKLSAGKFHRGPSVSCKPHSITSSARRMNDSGIVRPAAFAVLRLMTSSNLTACSTGKSAGLVPCKIRCT